MGHVNSTTTLQRKLYVCSSRVCRHFLTSIIHLLIRFLEVETLDCGNILKSEFSEDVEPADLYVEINFSVALLGSVSQTQHLQRDSCFAPLIDDRPLRHAIDPRLGMVPIKDLTLEDGAPPSPPPLRTCKPA